MNDTCEAPLVIPVELTSDGTSTIRQTVVDVRDTTSATTAPSDPAQSCTPGGASQNARSVWYSYAAPPPPMIGSLTVDTSTSSYDTVVTLHTGTCETLVQDLCGLDRVARSLFFGSVTGPFLIEVTDVSPEGRGGRLHLTLSYEAFF